MNICQSINYFFNYRFPFLLISDVTLPTVDTPTPSSSAAEVGLFSSRSPSVASSPRGVSRSVSKHNSLHKSVWVNVSSSMLTAG